MKNYCSAIDLLDDQPMVSASIEAAMRVNLPNWCIVGGFLRDLAWGSVFGRAVPPRDIDLIYLNHEDISPDTDRRIEENLQSISGLPFRVKNQARMHIYNAEERYISVADAMEKFPVTVSAIGITGSRSGSPVIFSTFGYEALFTPVFQITPHFIEKNRQDDFFAYLNRNRLPERWPEVPVETDLRCLFHSEAHVLGKP